MTRFLPNLPRVLNPRNGLVQSKTCHPCMRIVLGLKKTTTYDQIFSLKGQSYLPRVLNPRIDPVYSITCHTCMNDQSLTKSLHILQSPHRAAPENGTTSGNRLIFPRKMIVADFVIMHERRSSCVYAVVLIIKSSNLVVTSPISLIISGLSRVIGCPLGFSGRVDGLWGKC